MGATPTVIEVCFGPFRLDPGNARLLRAGRPVALTPKAFDVLHHLAGRPQRLVTKEELFSAVWPDVIVSDASIKVCVREIRKALEDNPKSPTYIETAHRRGYRFIAAVEGEQPESGGETKPTDAIFAHAPMDDGATQADRLVGRDEEIARLQASFRVALSGERQCVFVAGGPGTGKTSLAETFIRQLPEIGA